MDELGKAPHERYVDFGQAVVSLARNYHTGIEDLWDALTNRERIPRWLLPVEGEPGPGGRFQLEGNAGGEIRICLPPTDLELTWELNGRSSMVWLQLQPVDGDNTRLLMEHRVPPDDHWREFGPGGVGVGWDLSLLALGNYLEGIHNLSPEEVRHFIRQSSRDWLRAALAGGAERGWCVRAEEATRRLHTGT